MAIVMGNGNGGNGNQYLHEDAVDSQTAAAFLGIHYKTIERMARMGQLSATKPGKSWQFLLSLLSEWRKEQMNSNLKHPLNNHEQKENEPK
jgi:excisionase family DNA binding protein